MRDQPSNCAVCANAFCIRLEAELQRRPARRAPAARAPSGSPPDRRRPGRRGSSCPPRGAGTGRRCRSPRPARRTASRDSRAALRERIEVDDDEIDQLDALGRDRLEVVGTMAPGEDAAVDLRVQRLDAAVHHLGKAGHVGDVDDRQPGVREGLRRCRPWRPARRPGRPGRGRARPGRFYRKHSELHAYLSIFLTQSESGRYYDPGAGGPAS